MGVFSILKSFRNKNVKCSYCPYMVQYSDIVSELCQKWNDITDYTTVPVSGKYIIACKGDNRILYEIQDYLVGELFCEYYQAKHDGFHTIKPIKYLYIPELEI